MAETMLDRYPIAKQRLSRLVVKDKTPRVVSEDIMSILAIASEAEKLRAELLDAQTTARTLAEWSKYRAFSAEPNMLETIKKALSYPKRGE